MREVANRLERMGCINRDIRLAVAATGPSCDRLLALRADFSFESNQLLNQLTGKLRETEQAQLASRLLDAFVAMQQVILRHQQNWPLAEIERDPEAYVVGSRKVQAAVIGFLEEALDEVDEAARSARKHLALHTPARIRRTAVRQFTRIPRRERMPSDKPTRTCQSSETVARTPTLLERALV